MTNNDAHGKLAPVLGLCGLLLRTAVIVAPLVCLAGIFLMTAGTDETWILFSVRGLVEHGRYAAESPGNSVLTTGGAYTLLSALLHFIGDGRLEIVRLLSVMSFAALLWTLRLWALRKDITGNLCWLVTAAPLLVPGTFMLGAQAYGAVLAFFLVAVGLMLWGELEPGSIRRRLLIAILLGTAVATRQNVVFALVAPLIVVLLTRSNRTQLIDSLLVFVLGGLIYFAEKSLLSSISVNLISNPGASGLVNPLSIPLGYWIPLRLANWSIAQSFLPLVLCVLVTIGWLRARSLIIKPQGIDALLAFAWMAMLVWMLMAPIPHLRYIWPALAAFAVVGAFSMAMLSIKHALHPGNVLAIGLAIIATGYLDGARTYLHGESDILSWQLNRETGYSLQFGPFRQLQYQQAIVARIEQLPTDQAIATLGFNTALSFITRRTIVPVKAYYPSEGKQGAVFWKPAEASPPIRPRFILSIPFVNRYPNGYMSHQLYAWLKANTRVVDRQGPYVLYEVTGTFPDTPEVFSLEKWGPSLP
jgi:hypothetical protein